MADLLDALEALPLPPPPKARPDPGARGPDSFAWHLAPKGHSLHVDVLTCREIPRGWHEVDRLPHGYLPAPGQDEWEDLGAGERAALEALRAWNRKPEGMPFPLLAALEGHTRLSWAAAPGYAGYRVALAREIPTLIVAERPEGWHMRLSIRPGRHKTLLRLEGDRLLFTAHTPLHEALDRLLQEGHSIGRTQEPRLAAILARLLPHIPMLTDLLPDPAPAEAKPDRALGLWLKGGNERLDVRCFIQPARGLPWLLPGEGPAFILGGPPPARICWRRDRLMEKRRAAQVRELLPEDAKALDPVSWRIQGHVRVAAFLAGVRDLGARVRREGVPGLTPELPRTPTLKLSVRRGRTHLVLEGTLDGEPLAPLLPSLRGAARFLTLRNGSLLDLTGLLGLRQLAVWAEARGSTLRLPLQAAPILEGIDRQLPMDAPPSVPATFVGTLRAYQLEGFQWLASRLGAGLGACLADDMGLGKTVQTAALLLHRAERGPALVVAPTSVAANWRSELARFAPALQVHVLGEKSDRAHVLATAGPCDVIVASYGLLGQEGLQEAVWGTVVLDEAHAIKNAETQRAQASRQLRAHGRLALTGTPVENHPAELASLMGWLLPDLEERFRSAPDTETLKLLAAPFLLRRRKAEVLTELPPRTDLTVRVELDAVEADFHRGLLARCRSEAAAGGTLHLLAALMKLRRACAHPSLVDPAYTGPGAKVDLLLDRLGTLREEGHRCLVFSQFTDLLDLVQERLGRAKLTHVRLDGGMAPKARQRSVDAFQGGEAAVFLLSLKAGGTGLNLTAADDVFHLDPWWNPAVEDQASDRAHRMGRTRPVIVHRLVAAGTIEERVLALHAAKRAMVEDLLEGREQGLPLDRMLLQELLG